MNRITSIISAASTGVLFASFAIAQDFVDSSTPDHELLAGKDKEFAFSLKQPSVELTFSVDGAGSAAIDYEGDTIVLTGDVDDKQSATAIVRAFKQVTGEQAVRSALDVE
jgi:hypothetical protein